MSKKRLKKQLEKETKSKQRLEKQLEKETETLLFSEFDEDTAESLLKAYKENGMESLVDELGRHFNKKPGAPKEYNDAVVRLAKAFFSENAGAKESVPTPAVPTPAPVPAMPVRGLPAVANDNQQRTNSAALALTGSALVGTILFVVAAFVVVATLGAAIQYRQEIARKLGFGRREAPAQEAVAEVNPVLEVPATGMPATGMPEPVTGQFSIAAVASRKHSAKHQQSRESRGGRQ